MKIVCWLKTIYRTIITKQFLYFRLVSGHDYIEKDKGIIVCEICGRKESL